MKTVCLVTSTRADYGILRPLIRRLHNAAAMSFRLVATGTHLCPEFGNTVTEIEADGFPIHRRIEIQLSGDAPAVMSKSMGMALIAFADYFRQHAPDLLVVLGDRYEIAAVCCAAVNQRVPIAHLYGGEITEGAVDNSFRHAITKMASLHFTSAEPYRKRVIQMGEPPDTVFDVGAMGVENVQALAGIALPRLAAEIGCPLSEGKYAVVTFHPVTLEDGTGLAQVRELMAAMDAFPELRFVVTKANSDAGGREINQEWERYADERENCLLTASLGAERYLSALKHAAFMLGNSSSGIAEGPAAGIPTVNIGDRQKGRLRVASIIDCAPTRGDIVRAIGTALDPEFRRRAKAAVASTDGSSSDRVFTAIMDFLDKGIDPKKVFYDIDPK